jgi:glutamine amidotransferase
MCELLALSANTPTDMRFSFHGLTRRGGATGDHADGWGLASYDPDGQGVSLYREDAAAAFSPIAARVAALDLRAHCSIAHIRKATQGVVSLENCHPFHRRWQGQGWIFAHNGDLKGAPGADLKDGQTPRPGGDLEHDIPLRGDFQPEGDTDSERAFCWLLERLEASGLDPGDEAGLFATLTEAAHQLARLGTFNCLISNGRWLFAYATTQLHHLTRRSPFSQATLADDDLSVDFAELAGPTDVVTIVSTAPLTTNEPWQAFEPNSALLLRHGEICRQS